MLSIYMESVIPVSNEDTFKLADLLVRLHRCSDAYGDDAIITIRDTQFENTLEMVISEGPKNE